MRLRRFGIGGKGSKGETMLNNDAAAMIDFMLDNLSGVAMEAARARAEIAVEITHANGSETRDGCLPSRQRKTFLYIVKGVATLKNLRVIHQQCR